MPWGGHDMQIVRIAWLFTLLIIAATFGSVPTARADLLISCGGCSPTVLGGTPITAAASLAPPAFLLSRNPNDNSGLPQFHGVTPVVLIPDNVANGANLSFTELMRQGSTPIAIGAPLCDFACSVPATWTSGRMGIARIRSPFLFRRLLGHWSVCCVRRFDCGDPSRGPRRPRLFRLCPSLRGGRFFCPRKRCER